VSGCTSTIVLIRKINKIVKIGSVYYLTLSANATATGTGINFTGYYGVLQFPVPHNLAVSDQVVLANYVSTGTSTAWNGTYSVIFVQDSLDIWIPITSAAGAVTDVGNTTFISGAAVGAHLICQEAMS
jgi:hypothetical protein